ncbi:carbonic anhydrase 4b [Hoplias malabaricus]|uniref:carbonic anhydrase 4b n=1 Tax=Hoplias malabaricus TaxID=27720 RepID=UPI0034620AB2
MGTLYLCVLFASLLRITQCAGWCYKSQFSCENKCSVPSQWLGVAQSCGGKSQSPINIITKKVTIRSTLTPLKFNGYQDLFHGSITNNGHTVKVGLNGSAVISGGELEASYKAMEFHFHWGKKGGPGSEHSIDGEKYPMEMHIVHIKDKYKTVAEALQDPSGVAVLGILYKDTGNNNQKYDPIIKALANVRHPGNTSALGSLTLDALIPTLEARSQYFRYMGSLTTPNCTEAVIWTVFENPILLSKAQLSLFSELLFRNGMPMVDTFRPIQPLNDRKVFYSGSHIVPVSTMLVVSTALITFSNLLE